MPKTSELPKPTLAYERLKELIVNRTLVPGQKLIYRDLESLLAMSKTPIIHALSRLKQENMVEFHHNRGCYIKRWTREEVTQMLALRQKVHQIVVDNAIKNHSTDGLRSLRKALDAYLGYRCAAYDLTKFRLDWAFHSALARMNANAYLTSILNQQYCILSYCLDLERLTPLLERFQQDHIRVYEAIAAGDAATAKAVLRSHDRVSQKFISYRLDERDSAMEISSSTTKAVSPARRMTLSGSRSRSVKAPPPAQRPKRRPGAKRK